MSIPFWICGWGGCDEPAAQRTGDCLLCNRHLCRKHAQKPHHQCPTPDVSCFSADLSHADLNKENWESYSSQFAAAQSRYLQELGSKINELELCARASKLRGGIGCTVDLSQKSLAGRMGNQNCHAEIVFDDSIRWLARFRLAWTLSPPAEVRRYILRSEAATLMYLERNTRLPTPTIFDWGYASDPTNAIGVDYILMEKLDGTPLNWPAANLEQKEKILQQLADVFLEIERHPFSAVGSLVTLDRVSPHEPSVEGAPTDESSAFDVEGLACHSTFHLGKGALGPFTSPLDASKAIVQTFLTLIERGEIDARNPVNTYLAHRFRLDVVDGLFESSQPTDQLFLKHPDDKGDHILVNEAFDIIGIIDWEWTRTASKAEAFSSPCMLWPIGKFYDGFNELKAGEMRLAEILRERGRGDLAGYGENGRKVQRFFFCLGTEGAYDDEKTFAALFMGLQRAFGFEDADWAVWKGEALEKARNDPVLLQLLEREAQDQ